MVLYLKMETFPQVSRPLTGLCRAERIRAEAGELRSSRDPAPLFLDSRRWPVLPDGCKAAPVSPVFRPSEAVRSAFHWPVQFCAGKGTFCRFAGRTEAGAVPNEVPAPRTNHPPTAWKKRLLVTPTCARCREWCIPLQTSWKGELYPFCKHLRECLSHAFCFTQRIPSLRCLLEVRSRCLSCVPFHGGRGCDQ